MKNILVLVDNIAISSGILDKAKNMAPQKIQVIVVDPSVVENAPAVCKKIVTHLENPQLAAANITVEIAHIDIGESLAELIIGKSAQHATDLIMLQKPHFKEQPNKVDFAKQLLRGETKANIFFSQSEKWKSPIDIMCALDVGESDQRQRKLDSLVYSAATEFMPTSVNRQLHLATIIAVSRVGEELDIVEASSVLAKKRGLYSEKLASFSAGVANEAARKIDKSKNHIAAGIVAKEIPSLVKKNKIDVLVIGNVGRTGIKGFVIGNTAEKILLNNASDVLVINSPQG